LAGADPTSIAPWSPSKQKLSLKADTLNENWRERMKVASKAEEILALIAELPLPPPEWEPFPAHWRRPRPLTLNAE